MFLERRIIYLFANIFIAFIFNINTAYAKDVTRNVNVKINKPEIIFKYYIINTQFDRKKVKCQVYKPPDMRIYSKPKFGTVKFKKGVVIENDKLNSAEKKNCKDKVIKSTAVEFTGVKKGKESFKVEVFYGQGRYEEHIFGNIVFNVNVR